MEIKNYHIFLEEEWPECRLSAEMKAIEKGYDTLLCLNETEKFSGRSKLGIWCVGIPSEYYKVSNFINYEKKHKRKVIIWSGNKGIALQLFKQIKELGVKTYVILDNTRFLCHSTALENFHSILKDNALLSYNELINQGKVINTVRFELREPEDFYDYIDFCSCESISSEVVVASRQFGKINDDNNFKYKPGVRIYFSPKEVQQVQEGCVDGLHTFRVYKKLPLKYAKAFIFPTKHSFESIKRDENITEKIKEKMFYLEGDDYWTPNEFVNMANELVCKR